ncbi:exportin-6-like, partial [Pollicipes pollicipes]|uniref:exportin-6-like n=1 Tax=Pollicipes pollicipes TaxID=41117 RepID=UPI0018858BCF
SSVLKTLSSVAEEDEVTNEKQFVAILEAMGQSFLQADINVFRLNLATLQMLNCKWKLYHKPVFRRLLLARFMTVLLQTLLQRSHDLLRDEIAGCLHELAAVDFADFFDRFVPGVLLDTPGLDAPQRRTLAALLPRRTDLPTFSCGGDLYTAGTLRQYLKEVVNEALNVYCESLKQSGGGSSAFQCSCPAGFKWCAGHCYKLQEAFMTHDQADASCVQINSHLAVPRSREENLCVAVIASEEDTWLGINDRYS